MVITKPEKPAVECDMLCQTNHYHPETMQQRDFRVLGDIRKWKTRCNDTKQDPG